MEVNFKNIKSLLIKCSDGWVEVTSKENGEPLTMEALLSHLSINYNPEDIEWYDPMATAFDDTWAGVIDDELICNVIADGEYIN